MSKMEKRLEEATKKRESIVNGAGYSNEPDKAGLYETAVEFILTAGQMQEVEIRRKAVFLASVLLEMLSGTPPVMRFFENSRVDYNTFSLKIKDLLRRLHFNSDNDYYLALLLPMNADDPLINYRWKELMLLYHPDRNGGGSEPPSDSASDITKRLNEIYNVLKDPRKKFKYDQQHGRYGNPELQRPSSFSQPPDQSSVFDGGLKKFLLPAAVFVILIAVVGGAVYLKRPAQKTDLASSTKLLNDKPVETAFPPKDESAAKSGAEAKLPEADIVSEEAIGLGKKKDVSLAEEIYGFISNLERAFERGDLESYLSHYSLSASENGMNYSGIREYYRNLFAKGRASLSMGNMIISYDRNVVSLRGLFTVETLSDGKSLKPVRGSYTMRITKEKGRLKITYFQRVADKPVSN